MLRPSRTSLALVAVLLTSTSASALSLPKLKNPFAHDKAPAESSAPKPETAPKPKKAEKAPKPEKAKEESKGGFLSKLNPFDGKEAPSTKAASPPTASLTERKPLPAGAWAQSVSDVAADPDIRYGALPNGMRYALRKQSIPPGQTAIRLRFDAGSLDETDAQQGLAHFLEHMAFNGSKAVPEGDMVKILERLGLSFGADTNASTDFTETVYKLDLPKTDAATVDASLMLMREAAGNLLIDSAAVDRERGVVMSEERARDTPAYRIYKARSEFLLKGQLPPRRYPIGKVEVLRDAPASEIADFYKTWYRPERAVLVVVGDFDVDQMEAKIKARFSDWTAAAPAGPEPDLGQIEPRGSEARLVIEPGAPASLQIAWIAPPDRAADSVAKRKRDMVEQLGFAVLNRRYAAIARGGAPPFLGAGAFRSTQYDAADVAMVTVNAEAGRWESALKAAEQEQRRAVQYGVRQDELDREIAEIRAVLKQSVAGAATRRQSILASEIVNSLEDDEVVTSPTQDYALFEETVKGLTAAQVSKALAAAFEGQGPLVFMTSPTEVAGGEGAVLTALQTSQKLAVSAPEAPSQVAWPYESFGTPGKVASQRDIADMDAVFVTFENGVRLTVKPTKFNDDEVLVRVNIADGLVDLPGDRQSAAWGASSFIEGGLKQISADDMERVLADKLYGARFSVTDDAFVLTGSTRPDDLETELQVLTAYVKEPGWRPEAFARMQASGKTIHDQYEATAGGVVSRELGGLLHAGDRRWTFPSREEIAGARQSDLQAQIDPALARGSIEVVIVGDTTIEKAVQAVSETFGALPERPAPMLAPPAARQVGFPAPTAEPISLTHKGRPDQSMGYVAWKTGDFFANPQQARDNAILGEVLKLRLLDELREAQGATYSPSVGYNHSMVWQGWGYMAASVEVPPEKLPAFFSDVDKIAASLRDKDVGADELKRAKAPRIELLEKARVTNAYWLSELSGAQEDPRRLDAVRGAIAGAERVTPADIRRAAQTYLKPDREWKLEVVPAKK